MAETNTAEMQMKGLALSQLDTMARRLKQQAGAAAAAAVAAARVIIQNFFISCFPQVRFSSAFR